MTSGIGIKFVHICFLGFLLLGFLKIHPTENLFAIRTNDLEIA